MKSFIVLAALSGIAGTAVPSVSLDSTVLAEKTVIVAGRPQTTLAKPGTIVPGDRLIFQTSYHNSGSVAATKVVLNNPVPKSIAFSGDSSAGAEFSVDGGRTFGPLVALKVAGPTNQFRAAQPGDVTTIRWTIAVIAPGKSGLVKYRGIVR